MSSTTMRRWTGAEGRALKERQERAVLYSRGGNALDLALAADLCPPWGSVLEVYRGRPRLLDFLQGRQVDPRSYLGLGISTSQPSPPGGPQGSKAPAWDFPTIFLRGRQRGLPRAVIREGPFDLVAITTELGEIPSLAAFIPVSHRGTILTLHHPTGAGEAEADVLPRLRKEGDWRVLRWRGGSMILAHPGSPS